MSEKTGLEMLAKRIKVAMGAIKADLVLKNAVVPNLFTNEFEKGDVAIVDGYIAGIGEFEGNETVDCRNGCVCPGFIDGHVHIESTMAKPSEFAKAVVPHGTLTAIADPHEIANVCGLKGIQYFIDETEHLPITVFFMAPSCVPATPFEYNGALLTADQLLKLKQYPRVLGLGEVMDYVSVVNTSEEMLQKLAAFKTRTIDGHLTGVSGKTAAAYVSAGILTNHECATPEEVLECLRLGMFVQVREGSSAKNLDMVLSTVKKYRLPTDRLFFCTDDKNLDDIREEGHILNNVRKALHHGFEIFEVLQMASLNAARCYGIKDRGAVSPGYRADLLVVSDLKEFSIQRVIHGGKTVSINGSKPEVESTSQRDPDIWETVHIASVSSEQLQIRPSGDEANVVSIVPEQIVTRLEKAKVPIKDGLFVPDKEFSKAAVIERHKATGKIGLGIVKGFGIVGGAIASTISHDSHNLIVIGDNDKDIMTAIETVRARGGGLYLVSRGKVLAGLPLPIAGLMSDMSAAEISSSLSGLKLQAYEHGVNKQIDPFGLLSFISLPVIPEARITPDGLFNVVDFRVISV